MRRRPALVAVLLTLLIQVGLQVIKPWPTVFLLDYVLGSERWPSWLERLLAGLPGSHLPASLVGWAVGATLAIFLLNWAVGLVEEYAGISLGQRMIYDLAADLFARLQNLSLRFHTSRSVGDNIRRVTSDCACISVILKDALLPAASATVSLATMFTIMLRINLPLTFLSLAVVPYMIWVFRKYAQPMADLSYQEQEAEGRIYEAVEQTFSAMPVVQAFCRESSNDRAFAGMTRRTIAAALTLIRVELWFKILMGLGTAVGTAAILWLGASLAMAGHLTVGIIVLFLSYLESLYRPLESVMYSSSTIQASAGSARRVLEIMEAEREVADRPGAPELPAVRGHVRLENVTYGYKPDHPVLRGLTLEAQPGEAIALVGSTGAGKTTLASLIPRFFDPWEGRVLIDGYDLREVTLRSLRQQIALVLQEPFLFPVTVRENIAYGRPEATMEQVQAAARTARAHEFICQLPEGYQTVLGERGATLSGGQRQRLSIARALLKDSPILVLDEPTSALDTETEQQLLEALEQLMTRRTTFIIAHRLSTIRRATRILFLKDGTAAELGTHDDLLARGGLYAGFYHAQFGAHA